MLNYVSCHIGERQGRDLGKQLFHCFNVEPRLIRTEVCALSHAQTSVNGHVSSDSLNGCKCAICTLYTNFDITFTIAVPMPSYPNQPQDSVVLIPNPHTLQKHYTLIDCCIHTANVLDIMHVCRNEKHVLRPPFPFAHTLDKPARKPSSLLTSLRRFLPQTEGQWDNLSSVSYTHLTLPTKRIV